MATEAIGSSTADQADTRPYAPGWLHALLIWLDRLPGPIWIAYAVIALVETSLFQAIFWTTGRAPVGEIVPVNVYWGAITVALLWLAASLERVAAAAVSDARPALRLSDVDIGRLNDELASAPAKSSAVVLIGSIAFTVVLYVFDPVGAGIDRVAGPLALAAFGFEVLNVSVQFVIVYQLLRQMRLVRRTLEAHAIVDLFRPGPLSGFSRLTSRAAIGLVVVGSAAFLVFPVSGDPGQLLIDSAPYVLLPALLATLALVVPLYGFHERLVTEKQRLQDEAETRLKGLLAEVNHDIDTRDMARADAMNKTLASMLAQRDVLAKLPTWPWSAGTFRGFVTAIMLPLSIFLIQRVLLQFV